MKRLPLLRGTLPRGSAVFVKSRLALYRASGSAVAMTQALLRGLAAGLAGVGLALSAPLFRAAGFFAGALAAPAPSGFSIDFLSAAIRSMTLAPLGRAGSSSGVTLPRLALSLRATRSFSAST